MTGPYIVTTTTRKDAIERSLGLAARPARLAVTTLEEARDWIVQTLGLESEADLPVALPREDGSMTVGPLPDGTLIEVHRTTEFALKVKASVSPRCTLAETIDAYNAQQKAAA